MSQQSNLKRVSDLLKDLGPLRLDELEQLLPDFTRKQIRNSLTTLIAYNSADRKHIGQKVCFEHIESARTFRQPHGRGPRKIGIRRGTSTGVPAPAPYARGFRWGAGLA